MIDFDLLINIVNAAAGVIFPVLLGLTLRKQIQRVRWYRRRGKRKPVILKRGIAMMSSFAALYGAGLTIRLLNAGPTFAEVGFPRFAYLLLTTALMVFVFGYYTKTEYIDMEDPDKE